MLLRIDVFIVDPFSIGSYLAAWCVISGRSGVVSAVSSLSHNKKKIGVKKGKNR
jgi:hypothetical protein